jgi:hypothetical protein
MKMGLADGIGLVIKEIQNLQNDIKVFRSYKIRKNKLKYKQRFKNLIKNI